VSGSLYSYKSSHSTGGSAGGVSTTLTSTSYSNSTQNYSYDITRTTYGTNWVNYVKNMVTGASTINFTMTLTVVLPQPTATD
jgi:nucleoside phosphorylase